MNFEHDYYFPPRHREGQTVLCMRCEEKVVAPGMTAEEMKSMYREKKMKWVNANGVKGDGIIILCPTCLPLEIEFKHFPLIQRQIMKGLEDQAKWAKLPYENNLKDMKIMNEEAI